jgi:hypothetical protein
MLFVKIHYGLGNQLFQYALARSLSLKKGTAFSLDLTFFDEFSNDEHPRVYQLNHFNLEAPAASPEQLSPYLHPPLLKKKWRSVTSRVLPYYKRKVVYEAKLDFDEHIWEVEDNSFLFGFWQDERYFSAIGDTLRKDLTFKTGPAPRDKEYLREIGRTESVCLHIRRGDFLTDPFIVNVMGMCDMDYYHTAVDRIAQRVAAPVFYIFSDDPQWVRDNFRIDHPMIVVDHNSQLEAFQDLRLMSACKHHVISNSTFSWWGAWLSAYEEKIVFVPRVWRAKGPNMFTPKGWNPL